MIRTTLAAIALLIPSVLFAEVRVQVRASVSTPEVILVDDPWFEERECDGDARVNVEYQWTLDHGVRVLTYRQVTFSPFSRGWVFGPWMIHHGRYVSHNIHRGHNHMVRVFSHYDSYHRPHYTYEYRDGRHQYRSPVTINRYEYYGYDHNTHQNDHRGNHRRDNDRRFEQNSYERQYQTQPQQMTTVRNEVHTYTPNTTPVYTRNEVRRENAETPVIRVTERERIR